MNPNQLGKSGDQPRPALPQRAPGTAPLKTPGAQAAEAPPPAPPPPPPPVAKLARDGDATSNLARQRADAAANAYSNLLLKADMQSKTWDDAFGKFTARASQEDATRKFQEREGGKKAAEQQNGPAGGAEELRSTGKVLLSKVKRAEKEEEVDETGVPEAEPDVFSSDENGTLEKQKVDQLPKERQGSYEQVAKHMKNDPEARLALQSLLLEGKIPGTLNDQDANDLLANLDAFATMELDPEIDRWALIADVLADLGRPSAIVSGEGPTDPVMNVLIMLAASHPAEYVRLIRLLASPEGMARLGNGKKVKRNGRQRSGGGRWSARLLWECLDEAWDEDDDEDDEPDRGRGQGGQGQGQGGQGQGGQGQGQGQGAQGGGQGGQGGRGGR